MKAKVSFKGKDSWLPKEDLLPTRQEGILFTIDCLNSHKYNFDYCLEELIKETKQLQSNWNSLRECIIGVIEGAREELNTIIHTTDINTKEGLEYVNQCSREFDVIRKNLEIVLDKMNELESGDNK